jgi:cyclomaltodextrinase / maltogenic alpha-amylase / neopullulanase
MEENFTTPDWVKHAIFYQIFPDRFAASERVEKPGNLEAWEAVPTVHGFKGGDLLGVAEKLDYLKELGITAIYFNPIFQSAANHRYHTHDYYRVDPLLGGDAAFDELLEQAHQRGIKVVLDGVFNHASRGFFQFNHILECGAQSPYIDWFDIKGFPLNAYQENGEMVNYAAWVGLPALPEFNTDNPQVRQFIFDVARYWLEKGIDGWRLDVPFCIEDDAFWQEFRRVVKSANSEAYIVGEIAWEAQKWLQGDMFDAVMNYPFTQSCLGFFARQTLNRELEEKMMGLDPCSLLDGERFMKRAVELLALYPAEAVLVQMNLLDSHDMPRFLSLASGDKSALRLATLFQMTYPGAPTIYYGNEIGIPYGTRRLDLDTRYGFPWDESQWDYEMLAYFKECTALRHAHPALRTGEFTPLYAQGDVIAYLRSSEEERLLVVINASRESWKLDIPVGEHFANGTHLHTVFGGSGVARVVDGRLTHLALPPRSGAVFSR